MRLYTDSPAFAARLLPADVGDWQAAASPPAVVASVLRRLAPDRSLHAGELPGWPFQHLILIESAPRSQFDELIRLIGEGAALPDGMLCLAGTGRGFHGFKQRPWSAAPGNLHLSIHLAPARPVPHAATAFTVLAAVSAVDTIDGLPGLAQEAGLKWVNDILIGGAKVGGVLAHTQELAGTIQAAVLGIGLNVETVPPVEATPFVPEVGSLQAASVGDAAPSLRDVLALLLPVLDRNYRGLLGGDYDALLARYRQRSLVVGRRVTVCHERARTGADVVAEGIVDAVGDDLELFLRGVERPVVSGRLILSPERG